MQRRWMQARENMDSFERSRPIFLREIFCPGTIRTVVSYLMAKMTGLLRRSFLSLAIRVQGRLNAKVFYHEEEIHFIRAGVLYAGGMYYFSTSTRYADADAKATGNGN
jgi:hypothetical protein